jgi:hypothetical protein
MYVLLYCGVCPGVKLLPPDENPIAVRNNNNNNNDNNNNNNNNNVGNVRSYCTESVPSVYFLCGKTTSRLMIFTNIKGSLF